MKKYLILLSALVAVVGCNPAVPDDPNIGEYGFKTTEEGEVILRGIFNADSLNTFSAKDDHSVLELASQIPSGIDYELYRGNGEIMRSVIDGVALTSTYFIEDCGDQEWIHGQSRYNGEDINGVEFLLRAGLRKYTGSTEMFPYMSCSQYGEPMTSIVTCNNWWMLGDSMDTDNAASRSYGWTDDLNFGCGVKSYYTRLFFGGYTHKESPYVWLDAKSSKTGFSVKELNSEDKAITGLRLVTGEGAPKEIVDAATGITWIRAEIFFDGDHYYCEKHARKGADLNDGARGDWLYLYYTKDERTGRKIMMANPGILDDYKKSLLKQDNNDLNIGGLGCGLMTWHFNESEYKIKSHLLVRNLLISVSKKVSTEFKGYWSPDYTDQRVDFIRLYNKSMKPVDEGYPADFNRNARGDDCFFISYNYITETTAPESWKRF